MEQTIITKTDRLVYCIDCCSWDATRKNYLHRCRICASPNIHQATHEAWARKFKPQLGFVYHGSTRITVVPGSIAFKVLSKLHERYA